MAVGSAGTLANKAAGVLTGLVRRGAEQAFPDGELDTLTDETARALGFHHGCYVRLSRSGGPVFPEFVFGHCDPEWQASCFSARYPAGDPIVHRVFRQLFAFTLQELDVSKRDSVSQRLLLEERGMRSQDTVICPTFGPMGEHGALIFLSETVVDLSKQARFYLHCIAEALLSIHYNTALEHVAVRDEGPSLSPREAECLYWVSQGKSATDIGAILGISSHTVREYMNSTMAKLGAKSREETILRAMPLGLLVSHR